MSRTVPSGDQAESRRREALPGSCGPCRVDLLYPHFSWDHMELQEKFKNIKINETLEARDTVPSTSAPETSDQGVLPQGTVNHAGTGLNRNLSGAQRRKLLKQKAIEEGRPAPKFGAMRRQRRREQRRAGTDSGSTAPASEMVQTGKRQASSSLGSAADRRVSKPLKRQKTEGSYAAVASHLPRVILTCGDYLGGEMPVDVCKKLQEAVVNRLIPIEDGAFVPRFAESFPRKGSMIFVCEDKESGAWLEEVAKDLDLGQPDLKARVVAPEELKITKVITRLPPGVKNATDFLKLARKQNGGVDTTRWAVLKQTPEGCLILGLDEPSVVTLKNRGLRLLVGVGKATFRLLERHTARPATAALGEGAAME